MKNCDRGLENAAEAAGRGQHFQAQGHSFLLYGPTLSRQITYLFISCNKLAYKWVYATLSLNWLGLCAVYKQSQKLNLTSERASEQLTCNETCIKEQVYFELLYMYMYFMKVASSLLVKCFKIVFPM